LTCKKFLNIFSWQGNKCDTLCEKISVIKQVYEKYNRTQLEIISITNDETNGKNEEFMKKKILFLRSK